MRTTLIIFICVLLSLGSGFAQDQRADSALQKGDYDTAFKLLSARLVSNPNDTAAQKDLLRVYIETGKRADLN